MEVGDVSYQRESSDPLTSVSYLCRKSLRLAFEVTNDLEALVIRRLLKDRCEMSHRSCIDAVSISWPSRQPVASPPDGCVDRYVQEVHHRVKSSSSGSIERICPSLLAPMVPVEDHVDPEP
jgi:hypothetical protein